MHDVGLTRIRGTRCASRSKAPRSPAASSSARGCRPTGRAGRDRDHPAHAAIGDARRWRRERPARSRDRARCPRRRVRARRRGPASVMREFPRRAFDRHFLDAIGARRRSADLPERATPAPSVGRLDGPVAVAAARRVSARGTPMAAEPVVRERYPPIEPYETGMLDVGDGQSMYWEVSGNPDGKPAVALHGGPGSGSTPGWRRWFDPARYRIVQFDQRGCGRSTPHAGDLATDLATNTTHHLIADIERLREHLGIERWLVVGRLLGRHAGARLRGAVPGSRLRDGPAVDHQDPARRRPLVGAGRRSLLSRGVGAGSAPACPKPSATATSPPRMTGCINGDADPAVRLQAVRDWVAWEDAILSLEEGYVSPNPRWADERYMVAFARLVTHYFSHAAWLEEDEHSANAPRLAGIPGVLVHGRLDLAGPPDIAWELARAWPGRRAPLHPGRPHRRRRDGPDPARLDRPVRLGSMTPWTRRSDRHGRRAPRYVQSSAARRVDQPARPVAAGDRRRGTGAGARRRAAPRPRASANSSRASAIRPAPANISAAQSVIWSSSGASAWASSIAAAADARSPALAGASDRSNAS